MFKPNVITCPYCKGNTKANRKTLYLYIDTNTYHCHRCQAHGNISQLEDVEISLERKPTATLSEAWNNLGDRFSVCRQRNFENGKDTFQIKLPNGKVIGQHTRSRGKRSKTEGLRGFGYRESFLDPTQIYRVVEGPYDCIYPNDVCVFGIPSEAQGKLLKPYKLILCPDGDIWTSEKSVLQWFKPFLWSNVVAVERLPDDKDPDEIPSKERTEIEWQKLKQWLWKNK